MAEERDLKEQARDEILAAAQTWVDQWVESADMSGVVTGAVVIIEAALTDSDYKQLCWAALGPSGEGLASHQILGMLTDVEHEVLAHTLRTRATPDSD